MTDIDSEIVEDTKNTPLADVTDDSCVLKLIEIVPLDRTADDDQKPEVVPPLFVLKPEVLQDVKEELADDCDTEGPSCAIQVRSTSSHVVLGVVAFLYLFQTVNVVQLNMSETMLYWKYCANCNLQLLN